MVDVRDTARLEKAADSLQGATANHDGRRYDKVAN
jgi:hypothetical protein